MVELAWQGSHEASDAWDSVFLSDGTTEIRLPGTWHIPDLEPKDDIEAPKAKGTAGAKVKNQGELPRRFTLVGQLWVDPDPAVYDAHWVLWQVSVLPMLLGAKKGKDRTALYVRHPLTAVESVSKIIVYGRAYSRPERGIMLIKLSCQEWVDYPKAVKATTKPKAKSAPASPGPTTWDQGSWRDEDWRKDAQKERDAMIRDTVF